MIMAVGTNEYSADPDKKVAIPFTVEIANHK